MRRVQTRHLLAGDNSERARLIRSDLGKLATQIENILECGYSVTSRIELQIDKDEFAIVIDDEGDVEVKQERSVFN